ncbi:MAG: prepilin-type N-terminal cleavage/methylation domain-containing protein [Acidisphaera sp.]|nr:prepilin-type N-terminal cleavage/methylation domain-containing protein [Acidisphaera sp.]
MRAERGFTLLEVIIALVIAALALGALLQSAVSGLAGVQAATSYEEAIARARSRLAALDGSPLATGDRQGDDGGGYHWHERILQVAQAPAGAGTAMPALYAVSVAISWQSRGGSRSVQLDTERTAAAGGR